MTSSVRSHSLLEQKKLQWAKEREEMLGLCGIWGSFARSYHDSDRSSIRSQYLSSIDLNHHVDTSPDASDASGEDRDSHSTSTMKFSLRRSPSLPPIFSPEKQSSCYGNDGDAEGEDEGETGDGEEGGTSGYASDSGGGNEYHVAQAWGGAIQRNPTSTANQWQSHNNFRRRQSPDSVTCSSEMGRPRWGDKGVGVGHLWAPTTHNPEARLPQVSDRPGPTPPAWLHRRLNKLGEPAQILVISHRDDASTRSKDFTGAVILSTHPNVQRLRILEDKIYLWSQKSWLNEK
ncbi:uncharacterized protein LOC120351518 isoform X1 [Nilaparvata lugens]|uniref:uncharacterized protein LOC120351518 isoform X1 n=1 Tax=Nilaparvata lugens TaxID=108931 RepID=UPI00193D9168|nr:uncharacterized protein LOC120351518 isoform X1 [Nilaparvata lugens]